MPQPSSLLIVVPCLDEEAALPDLLAWLVQEAGPDALIVVADGGSRDSSVAIVEHFALQHPMVRLMDNPHRVQSAAVNLAAKRFGADRDWLVRIDAHCGYPVGYIDRLLDSARLHEATSVVVPMVTQGGACFQSAAAAAQNSVMGTGGSPHRHLVSGRYVDHGHHALFNLAAFLAVGGYDETFSHNEDAELDHRLGLAGGRIWLEPKASLIYHPRKTAGRLLRQYWNYGRGRARTVAKHQLTLKLRQAAPLVTAPSIVLALLGLVLATVDSRFALLALPALAWALLCQAFAVMLALRARSVCVLASGLAAMVMHAGWSAGYWSWLFSARRVVPAQAIR
ncbi:glycosyltransferase family 2 protein [Sphingomonas sp. RB3P16]|uniref:glycosyltransferase family 2 protein n=1 Tax=Parasphingomonas frigoris TaxID=3096163 RepID=UPI002FCA0EB9